MKNDQAHFIVKGVVVVSYEGGGSTFALVHISKVNHASIALGLCESHETLPTI